MNFEIIACAPLSPEWYALRRQGIGGSDAAPALGMSKWGTPYSLYLDKRGEADPIDETWEMKRGKAMEPLLRQNYADETGRTVLEIGGIARSTKYPFMLYNPDGVTECGRLVELKTAAYATEWGDEHSDEIPKEYLLQVQHGMIVMGQSACDVQVSIVGRKPRSFIIEADKELQEMIIENEAALWQEIVDGTPPPPTTAEDVARMYRVVNPGAMIATDEILATWLHLVGVRGQIKHLEEEKEIAEIAIKAFLGEKDVLIRDTGAVMCTWKQQAGAQRIDSKRLRAERPDVAAEFTNAGEPLRRLLIK